MCGFLFATDKSGPVEQDKCAQLLERMSWRGPDAHQLVARRDGSTVLAHCRLAIVDPLARSDQPMRSRNGRYWIVFNGEIYNHIELRRQLALDCRTGSDTETILEAYAKVGEQAFELLDGMFALVIFDEWSGSWVAARDAFGIKPLFHSAKGDQVCIASEASVVATYFQHPVCEQSLAEWRLIRAPMPGYSFFQQVREVPPGTFLSSGGVSARFWEWPPGHHALDQERFEDALNSSVRAPELGDVSTVSLVSGGLDSSILTVLSSVERAYSVGMPGNNEFQGAREATDRAGCELVPVNLSGNELEHSWHQLARLRGEPLSVPNEGLIHAVCKAMGPREKVVLTGEGADELLFGYDNIFRWMNDAASFCPRQFLLRYGYSEQEPTERLLDHVSELARDLTPIQFCEDFFLQIHLPILLRRMDFGSMSASREARVPFVCKKLVEQLYRLPAAIKLSADESKIPLRRFAKRLGLHGTLERAKIGFSARVDGVSGRHAEYRRFQELNMEALGWS
ncbi:MAG: asparagine synthase (glutamine-hydrolyzing) [Wenzhouxiangella sp.]|nr:asparagine synthase (glutamine-hydrolyzing) [Wenzhouxiangella sp.]